jgi:hypothetical protein
MMHVQQNVKFESPCAMSTGEQLSTFRCGCGASIRMRWVRHVARVGEGGGAYGVLVGKPEATT